MLNWKDKSLQLDACAIHKTGCHFAGSIVPYIYQVYGRSRDHTNNHLLKGFDRARHAEGRLTRPIQSLLYIIMIEAWTAPAIVLRRCEPWWPVRIDALFSGIIMIRGHAGVDAGTNR